MSIRTSKSGYTLLEMSIVLVIITLLIGSVLLARELQRGAEARSAVSDSEQIQNAVYNFQQKYQYLPGDFPRAESYWTADGTCPTTAFNSTPKTATCNGNGDGRIDTPGWVTNCATAVSGYQQEPYRIWQHLTNAQLYRGIYTGVEGAANRPRYGVAGTNIPKSMKIKQVGFQIMNFDGDLLTGNGAGGANPYDTYWFQDRYYNVLFVGRQDDITSCFEPNQPFLSSIEAYNIDRKFDDGKPGTGNVRTFTSAVQPYCATSATAYSMNTNDRSCSLIWLMK